MIQGERVSEETKKAIIDVIADSKAMGVSRSRTCELLQIGGAPYSALVFPIHACGYQAGADPCTPCTAAG